MAGRYIYTTCMQCLTDAQKKIHGWLIIHLLITD